MNNLCVFWVSLLSSFAFTILFTKKLIPIIKSKKMGQMILEDGPNWHKAKEGTPTMGGVGFILAILISFLICFFMSLSAGQTREIVSILIVIIYAILNGLIGVVDDMAKIKNKRNKGLSAKKKFLLQTIAAVIFLISFKFFVGIETIIEIPFIKGQIELSWLFYIIAFLVLCGFVNAVNLSDGLDGLAACLTLSVGILFVFFGLIIKNDSGIVFLSSSLAGAMLGFLIFNYYPAKIFMGDTGSLFLGAIVVSFSFLLNNIALVLIYGFVFLIEAISVILQVAFFKITKGKRLFKMAPLHHHFEKCGWKETKVVWVFFLVNLVFCAVVYFGVI